MPRPAVPAPAAAAASGRGPGPRELGVVLAAGALLALTFALPSATRQHTWPWSALFLGLWVLPIAVVILGAGRGRRIRLPGIPVLAGLALLVAATLASAWLSPFRAAVLPQIWPTLGGAALWLGLHHFASEPDRSATGGNRTALALALAAVGGLFAGGSLVLWAVAHAPTPWATRNAVPFGHSNYVAGAAVLALPWLAWAAWQRRGAARFAAGAGLAAALAALASTSSRGGLAGAAVAAAIGFAGTLARGTWSRRTQGLALAAALLAGAALLASNSRLRELVFHGTWSESARESNAQRNAMLAAGWQLGLERPALGWGPGSVPLAYPQVRAQLDAGVDNVLQLHSTPAQLWATLGVPGLVAALLLAAALIGAARRAPRDALTLAALAALGGYGTVALTDHQLDLPFPNALGVASAALLTAGAARAAAGTENVSVSRTPRVVAGALAVAAGLALPATVRDLAARAHYDRALGALETGDPAGAAAALARAAETAPHDPFYVHQIAGLTLDGPAAGAAPADPAARQRAAIAVFERALATGVHLEVSHFNLGWLRLGLGEADAAARHFAAAARLVPDKGGVYFGLGLAHLAAGRKTDAVRALALEPLNDPRSLTSPAWDIPLLAALRPAIRAETLRLADDLAVRLPAARATAAWLRWWDGAGAEPPPADLAFNAESAAFSAAWPALAQRAPLPPGAAGYPWAAAYAAWRATAGADRFLGFARGDVAYAAALDRRASTAAGFADFLRRPTGDDAALVRTFRRERLGYGVLARHPEGPPLRDAYVVQDHRLAADAASGLFPRKGWLPGRFLLALLPADPR